jgi:hypothetical protein
LKIGTSYRQKCKELSPAKKYLEKEGKESDY